MADTNNYTLFQKVEKWTTKDNFNKLGNLTEIETGTEYNLTGAIDETDLDSDLQTKINGKLTKPTNPSAESAVTLLADGTVGTKLLSEIGGGGGGDKKLYLHKINALLNSGAGEIYINIINNSNTSLTENDYFHTCIGNGIVGCFNGSKGHGAVNISYLSPSYSIKGVLAKDSNSGYYLIIEDTFQLFIDTYTEL